ncbi:MAG: ABC transporter permease [Lachnospiraceae bacterium]|nr:ABC transporter permease [Lachnospiraceae bacterium]
MRFIDLLRMSVSNLWRRKLRTFLTVLGVIIGTASIVVMISLGLGLSKSTMEQIEQSGGLTTITVNEGSGVSYSSGSVAVATSSSTDENAGKITDSTAETIMAIPHVEVVSPVLTFNPILKVGAYEGNIYVRAMTAEALKAMDIPLTEGASLPTDPENLEFLYGNQVICDFYNSKTGSYEYWETGELPDIDLANDPIFFIMDSNAYWNAKYGGTDENGNPYPQPKKYMYGSTGVIAGGTEEYNEHSWNVYCNIDALKVQLKKIFKNSAIPNQPTRSNGKPYKEWYYNEMYVKVDEMENVAEVQKAITDMGYYAYSNAEWVEQMEGQYAMVQAVLGGIGAVSLFVAAIGIANTMMMSIYERTKEIGIMKVLGCSLGRIRDLFLMEAGFIGLSGGIVGLLLSYGISAIINTLLADSYYSQLSYIPLWLSGVALVFAVLIGMLAGLMPALRAMKLSALSALRNE